MDGSKVILFGSFTEDETKSFQKQLSENQEVPVVQKELQFGSLPLVSGEVLSISNGKRSKIPASSAKSETAIKKDASSVGSSDLLHGSGEAFKENGSVPTSSHFSSLSNGVQTNSDTSLDLASLSLSNSDGAVLLHPLLSTSQVDQDTGLKMTYTNGVHNGSQMLVPSKYEKKQVSNGPVVMNNLLPRGLINAGNLCFLNATLQALLSCSPFVKLLQDLRARDIPKVNYPILTAFVDFIMEFDMPHDSTLKKKDPTVIETGRPFSPAMFEDVVKNFTPDVPSGFSGRTRQEDAQEFLSFMMDRMHDELLKLGGQFSGNKSSLVSSSDDDDEWETVGPKNKKAVTRTQSFVPSELSAIFGGQLLSVVKAKGNKPSETVQPYLLLHLDIFPEAVNTIEDALHLYSQPERLEGYKASNTGKAGVASKSVKIQKLSKIMILHLKRFGFGSQGSTKLHKPVRFPSELVLGRELLVSPVNEGSRYELVATITHLGRDPSKGHYTADARHTNGQWLRFDDASVTAVPTNKVLHDQAYVLFYKQV